MLQEKMNRNNRHAAATNKLDMTLDEIIKHSKTKYTTEQLSSEKDYENDGNKNMQQKRRVVKGPVKKVIVHKDKVIIFFK